MKTKHGQTGTKSTILPNLPHHIIGTRHKQFVNALKLYTSQIGLKSMILLNLPARCTIQFTSSLKTTLDQSKINGIT